MRCIVIKSSNSAVIALPDEIIARLGISVGDEVVIEFWQHNRKVVISPANQPIPVGGVDENFARQVAEFMEQYRSTLEALARQ